MLGNRIGDAEGRGGKEKEILGLPNGNEYFILCSIGERTRVNISRYITRFNDLEIDESLFRIDSTHVHLAGVDAEQRIITPIPAGVGRGLRPCSRPTSSSDDSQTTNLFRPRLDSVDMAALYCFVVVDSKLGAGVWEILDGDLFGVNGILNDMALGFNGAAGIGGMVEDGVW